MYDRHEKNMTSSSSSKFICFFLFTGSIYTGLLFDITAFDLAIVLGQLILL